MYKPTLKAILKAKHPSQKGNTAIMQFHQVESQPHTYIVENDYGKQLGTVCNDRHRQLGTVDEFHRNDKVSYIATRFDSRGMFEQKEFSGFTAALQFVEKGQQDV